MKTFFINFIILSVLAAVSTLLYLFSPNENTEEENQVTKEVEFIVKNAELLGSSENGNFSYKIFSKKAKANDLNNQIFLEQVKLTYTDEDVNWIVTSDRGQIISDMNILSLSGNVLIRNNTENNNSKISTDYLEINPNTFTVATNRKVIIEINNNIIEAKGLSAQLKDNKLKFSSNINVNIQN